MPLPLFNRLHPNKGALFCFDHSQNHEATSPDALVAPKLNLSDSGKNTPIMRETNYNGLAQKLQYKKNQTILTERGLWIDGMRLFCHHNLILLHKKIGLRKQLKVLDIKWSSSLNFIAS